MAPDSPGWDCFSHILGDCHLYLSLLEGRSHMTSEKFSGFQTPSPLVCILARLILLNPRNLPYYVCVWIPPSPCRRHFKYGP